MGNKKTEKPIIKFFVGRPNANKQLAIKKPSKNKLNKSKLSKLSDDITYTYAIFPTKKGKGYGCFAVKPRKDGFFTVAASFCAPSDRAKFSKTRARNVAYNRLEAKTARVIEGEVSEERNRHALQEIILEFMRSSDRLPRWVEMAIDADMWLHTLKLDSMPSRKIINEVVKKSTGMNDNQVETLREIFSVA